jgi:hypothetical protein
VSDLTVKEQRDAGIVPPGTMPSESSKRRRLTTSSRTMTDVQNALFALQGRMDAMGNAISQMAGVILMLLQSRPFGLGLEDGTGEILDESGDPVLLEPSTPVMIVNGDHVLLEDGSDLLNEESFVILVEGENSPGFTSLPIVTDGSGGPSDFEGGDDGSDYQDSISDIAEAWNPYSNRVGNNGINTQT